MHPAHVYACVSWGAFQALQPLVIRLFLPTLARLPPRILVARLFTREFTRPNVYNFTVVNYV